MPFPPRAVPRLRTLALAAAVAAALLVPAARAVADDAPVTPAGFRITPAGQEIAVSKIAPGFQGPLASALTPDGQHLLSASSGAARQETADLFDLRAGAWTDAVYYDGMKAPGEAVFYGVAFAPDGHHAWVSGGGQQVVHALTVDGDRVSESTTIPTPGFIAGLAYGQTPLGPRLYAAVNLTVPGNANTNPGHELVVIDPRTNQVLKRIDLGTALQPFGVAFSRDGTKAFVTNWIGRSVTVVDTATETKIDDVALASDPLQADHPSAIAASPTRDEIYTANANSDTVSVLDSTTDAVVATIPVGLVPGGPKGATPDGLAPSPDGRTLYVALAGEDAVAVVDVATRRVRGFIPTAWYPTDVDVTPNGKQLVITNRNGHGAGPNVCGPHSPLTDCPASDPFRDSPREAIEPEHVLTMAKGSVQVVDVPSRDELDKMSAQVEDDDQADARRETKPAALDAIKHVIYVVKENRTYDQVLGDEPAGNGDARLELFDKSSAPNHHALAERFGLLDNFYADADISPDGHNWITQADADDYIEKTIPINYSSGPRGDQRSGDFGQSGRALPTEPLPSDPSVFRTAGAQTVGYLWDDAWAHGVSYRDYGELTNGDCKQPVSARNNASNLTHLQNKFGFPVDKAYPGFKITCYDHLDREPEWEREFAAYEQNGNLPALSFVDLPNDHNNGTAAGRPTPEAYMADNDLALGRMVDVLSHSRYWKDTVMLVTEDDAQNGPDHVDAHRTLGYAISAYSRGGVDSTHYDTASMVATAEDLLGLPPMNINDERVSRMWRSFDDTPDLRPYDAITPAVTPAGDAGAPVNQANAPMAAQSASWDFSDEDEAPEVALNQAIWKSIKGRHSHMPAPRHQHIIGDVSGG